MSLQVRSTRFRDGERYRLLVDAESGVPLHYPNLFVTSQIRNRSQSVAAMETALSAIKHLLAYCDEVTLEARIRSRSYFGAEELDAIRDHCELFAGESDRPVRRRPNGGLVLPGRVSRRVGKSHQYSRLSTAANYYEWLAQKVHGMGFSREDRAEATRVAHGLRKRRPKYRSNSLRNVGGKALSEEARDVLRRVVEPEHPLNPFHDPKGAERNYLIVRLALELGVRAGELLNIKVRDIDFQQYRLTVHRRADDQDDSRLNEPNAKTLARTLPLSRGLIQRITTYVTGVRSKIPNAGRNEFLFVTHKPGPTQGEPISKETLKQIFKRVAGAHPTLTGLHPHALRHTWNDEFSAQLDKLPPEDRPSEAEEEQMRNYLMGWKQGSGSAASYNQRHLRRKADAALLSLQEKMYESDRK